MGIVFHTGTKHWSPNDIISVCAVIYRFLPYKSSPSAIIKNDSNKEHIAERDQVIYITIPLKVTFSVHCSSPSQQKLIVGLLY